MTHDTNPCALDVVLFEGFELLDVFGPLEIFGAVPGGFEIRLLGPDARPVRSAQGPRVLTDGAYEAEPPCDAVLVPGGIGTRKLVEDGRFLEWLAAFARRARIVTSVCTGSALLASAGLLDGHRATSNKRAFAWVREHGPRVAWVAEARWVEDRDRWTSSGVAAGMDMALALVARLHSDELARSVADRVELEWHSDPDWDPFAAKNGLVPG